MDKIYEIYAKALEIFGLEKAALSVYERNRDYFEVGRLCNKLGLESRKIGFFESRLNGTESGNPERILAFARIAREMGLNQRASELYEKAIDKYTDPSLSKTPRQLYQKYIRACGVAREAGLGEKQIWLSTNMTNVASQDK